MRPHDCIGQTLSSRGTTWVAAVMVAIAVVLTGAVPALRAAEDGPAARVIEAMAPMRDGVRLATTVYLPAGSGPWPSILARTPYGRTRSGPPSARATTTAATPG